MKKLFFISIAFSMLFSLSGVLAYTKADVEFATFLADGNFIVRQSSNTDYRFQDTITRAEVIGIALKMKGIELPSNYTCKNYYSDVSYNSTNNWICRAVELAADNGIITRYNSRARPQESISRSEALAIIMNAGGMKD